MGSDATRLKNNLLWIFTELRAKSLQRDRVVKKIKKLSRQGRLDWFWGAASKYERDWAYRLCCADLSNGHFDWKGWECRSEWAWFMATNAQVYPRWNGAPCRLLVMAEQGLGDEIMFASALQDLL